MAKIIPPKITSGYLCDEQPTADSTNLMTSGDIYTAFESSNPYVEVEMPERITLGFQTALASMEFDKYKDVTAYSWDGSDDDNELAETFVNIVRAGKQVVPAFNTVGSLKAHPTQVSVSVGENTNQYDFYYYVPQESDFAGQPILFNIYVRLYIWDSFEAGTASFSIHVVGTVVVLQ